MNGLVAACWYGRRRRDRLARALLVPVSWLYARAVRLRNRLYDARILASERVAVPVVCVGNLVVGGTGKTPFVMWLIERLGEAGLGAAVVSRGYGSHADRPTVVVSSAPAAGDPLAALSPARARLVVLATAGPADAADEALLVAARTGAPVFSHPDRVLAASLAASLGVDLIVLDDGFQHRRLDRDLDVVLIDDAERYPRMLPAGPGREEADALARADFVVGCEAPLGSGIFVRTTALSLVASVESRDGEGLERVRGARVLAVAGIARPERLQSMLEGLGARAVELFAFDDHHVYGAADCARIRAAAAEHDLVVTTEKDLVKLERMDGFDGRLRALRLLTEVEGADALLARITELAGFDAKGRRTHHRGLAGLGGGSKAV